MKTRYLSERAIDQGKGVLRLAPAWVPRTFCRPGKRFKLHPDDYYILGLERGGIDERWLSSAITAKNGPATAEDEGLSYVIVDDDGKETCSAPGRCIRVQGSCCRHVCVEPVWENGRSFRSCSTIWVRFRIMCIMVGTMRRASARNTNRRCTFTLLSSTTTGASFPIRSFGLNPDTTKEQVKQALMNFTKGDNRILDLSRCYKLTPDTGWDVPTGILHAPGSYCTYEPQFASDVLAMYQSVLMGDHCVPESLLWQGSPPDKVGDYDYLIEVLDWEKNTDPDFHKNRFMAPRTAGNADDMAEEGYLLEDICYKSTVVGAQRLTIEPGRAVRLKDDMAYGFILLEGYGACGSHRIETPRGDPVRSANEGRILRNSGCRFRRDTVRKPIGYTAACPSSPLCKKGNPAGRDASQGGGYEGSTYWRIGQHQPGHRIRIASYGTRSLGIQSRAPHC